MSKNSGYKRIDDNQYDLLQYGNDAGGSDRSFYVASQFYLKTISDVDETVTVDLSLFGHYSASHDPDYKKMKADAPKSSWIRLSEKPKSAPVILPLNCKEVTDPVEIFYFSSSDDTIYTFSNWMLVVTTDFDLHTFPFDKQIFSVYISVLGYVIGKYEKFAQTPESGLLGFFMEGENNLNFLWNSITWRCHDILIKATKEVGNDLCSTVHYRMFMQRNSSFYLWNTQLIVYLVTLCGFSVCAIDIDDFATRMGLLCTLLLTITAYKISIVQFIPKVPYLTYLDKYLLSSIVVLTAIAVESYTLSDLKSDIAKRRDFYFNVGLGIAWTVMNFIVLVSALSDCGNETWKDVELKLKKESNKKKGWYVTGVRIAKR